MTVTSTVSVGFSHEDFAALLDKYDYHFNPGDVVAGTVFSLEPRGALIDIGAKTAAFLPIQEMSISRIDNSGEVLAPGETREFFILTEENEEGQLTLSIRRIEYMRAWDRVVTFVGDLDATKLSALAAFTVLTTGILCCMSRGGWVAAVGAGVVTLAMTALVGRRSVRGHVVVRRGGRHRAGPGGLVGSHRHGPRAVFDTVESASQDGDPDPALARRVVCGRGFLPYGKWAGHLSLCLPAVSTALVTGMVLSRGEPVPRSPSRRRDRRSGFVAQHAGVGRSGLCAAVALRRSLI